MGAFDMGQLVAQLMQTVKSPRVQYLGNSLSRTAQQYGNRPMGTNAPTRNSGGSSNSRGAMPQIGGALNQFITQAGKMAGASSPQQGQQTDPLMQMYAQLLDQLQQPVAQPTGIDRENLMKQVQDAINPIYDQRNSAARGQYGRAKTDVQGMYGQLADEYTKLAPQQIEQAKAAQDEIKELYGQLRSNVTGDFARVSKEQADLFQQLGIEDALPEVLADQQAPVQDALIAASENQAQNEQRYMDMGQADATYMREGAPLAKMQGNEVSQDLLFQLNDYLNQSNAERTSGIQSGYIDQLGNAQNQLAQMQQNAQSEAGRRQGMLFEMLQSQMQQKNAPAQDLNVDTFMAQLPPNVQQKVAGAFTQLQRSPEAVYGKVEDKRNPKPGSYVETTPEWYMQQADVMLQNGQIDPTTHQALLMYLQLYNNMGSR